MLIAFAREPFGEVALTGSSTELMQLAGLLRSGHGYLRAVVADSAPYDEGLTAVSISAEGDEDVVAIHVERGCLNFRGGQNGLTALAQMLSELSEVSLSPYHLHLEPTPGRSLVADGSVSLVIERAPS